MWAAFCEHKMLRRRTTEQPTNGTHPLHGARSRSSLVNLPCATTMNTLPPSAANWKPEPRTATGQPTAHRLQPLRELSLLLEIRICAQAAGTRAHEAVVVLEITAARPWSLGRGRITVDELVALFDLSERNEGEARPAASACLLAAPGHGVKDQIRETTVIEKVKRAYK